MAFVDTSDIWLAGRWPRVAVSLAGPYTNLVLSGFGVLVAGLVPNVAFAAALWQIALTSYLIALYNLNPLLEFDGYYALSDLLDRPNLRRHALAWFGRELPAVLRGHGAWRGHGVELLYWLAVLLYLALLVALTVACT